MMGSESLRKDLSLDYLLFCVLLRGSVALFPLNGHGGTNLFTVFAD